MKGVIEFYWRDKWLIVNDKKIALKLMKKYFFLLSFDKGRKDSLSMTFATSEEDIGDVFLDIQIRDIFAFQWRMVSLKKSKTNLIRVYGLFTNKHKEIKGCFGEVFTDHDCDYYDIKLLYQ